MDFIIDQEEENIPIKLNKSKTKNENLTFLNSDERGKMLAVEIKKQNDSKLEAIGKHKKTNKRYNRSRSNSHDKKETSNKELDTIKVKLI